MKLCNYRHCTRLDCVESAPYKVHSDDDDDDDDTPSMHLDDEPLALSLPPALSPSLLPPQPSPTNEDDKKLNPNTVDPEDWVYHIWVWMGTAYVMDDEFEGDTKAFAESVATELSVYLELPENAPLMIHFEPGGQETDDFWKAFFLEME
eukprot:TRINITY_DN6948_c0_g3_i1.p1 TRINITY_DN6948_c0_g3~~TRINITY_DN6948_c0_g3_i1.p1  ORF type:complete len:149 (+),score=33.15 TRINITY_DN6948_c0_g3_i1:137-583(+)